MYVTGIERERERGKGREGRFRGEREEDNARGREGGSRGRRGRDLGNCKHCLIVVFIGTQTFSVPTSLPTVHARPSVQAELDLCIYCSR
jgi:hypothetical protein